jgi:ribonucleases P/MRP protein subunit RPP40
MTPVLDFSHGQQPDAKMHVSIGELPSYVDPAQPPTKKSPWRQIQNVPFVQTATMIMPNEMYKLIWDKIEAETKKLRYAKVIMKLQDVLEGAFFTEYIKRGKVHSLAWVVLHPGKLVYLLSMTTRPLRN